MKSLKNNFMVYIYIYISRYNVYLFSVTTTSICLYIFKLFLFPSRTFANGSCVENKTSIAIMFKRLAARLIAVKNRVWGFVQMLTCTFSLVMISLLNDTIKFWFSLFIAVVGGMGSRN